MMNRPRRHFAGQLSTWGEEGGGRKGKGEGEGRVEEEGGRERWGRESGGGRVKGEVGVGVGGE